MGPHHPTQPAAPPPHQLHPRLVPPFHWGRAGWPTTHGLSPRLLNPRLAPSNTFGGGAIQPTTHSSAPQPAPPLISPHHPDRPMAPLPIQLHPLSALPHQLAVGWLVNLPQPLPWLLTPNDPQP
uniref:Uncharacterized protein n=1 Tax=Myotis myotis TaxID=51298 RepID=A0A7J7VIP3_MYOMY|nr:hypothetical protein mMyoMyo1_008342 [Myotis myotis]